MTVPVEVMVMEAAAVVRMLVVVVVIEIMALTGLLLAMVTVVSVMTMAATTCGPLPLVGVRLFSRLPYHHGSTLRGSTAPSVYRAPGQSWL